MKLSELVAFRNELNRLSLEDIKNSADASLQVITHLVSSKDIVNKNSQSTLDQKYQEILGSFNNFESALKIAKLEVQQLIAEHEKKWFQDSYRLFEEAQQCEVNDHILNNRRSAPSDLTKQADEILRSRLVIYGGWQYPGMIIRPGLEDYIESMVSYDPLYIIDQNYELLEPCLKKFPKLYQSRLRPYVINDWGDDPLLGKIPDSQFGVCLAYNVFNYRPLEVLRTYFSEIYKKLRPGGVLLMTFNDCDNEKAVMLVEQFCASYTPGYLVRDLAANIGFELISSWNDGGPNVWLELKKPGTLTSLRGGQTTARIGHLNDFQADIDFDRHRFYSSDEVEELQVRAKNLEIDDEVIESSTPFELQIKIDEILTKIRKEENLKREQIRLELVRQKALQYNIDPNDPDCEKLIHAAEQKEIAVENGIDINQENWQDILKQVLRQKEIERQQREEEERRLAIELENKRIADLHEWAWAHGVDPVMCPNEQEIRRQVAEAIDQGKRELLIKLRQRALELEVGNPSLVRYGYSAEKLQQLIKEKEEKLK